MLIVDAGPLYAAAATRDRHHKSAVELLTTAPRPLIVPALVVTEVAYLLADRIGPHAEVAFSPPPSCSANPSSTPTGPASPS
jgi:predicted nucleic acid-binding protein